jgi:Fe-S cluster assembly iron-binding protein IscA
MIQLTEKAAEMLKEIIAKQANPQDAMLRVYFGGFG